METQSPYPYGLAVLFCASQNDLSGGKARELLTGSQSRTVKSPPDCRGVRAAFSGASRFENNARSPRRLPPTVAMALSCLVPPQGDEDDQASAAQQRALRPLQHRMLSRFDTLDHLYRVAPPLTETCADGKENRWSSNIGHTTNVSHASNLSHASSNAGSASHASNVNNLTFVSRVVDAAIPSPARAGKIASHLLSDPLVSHFAAAAISPACDRWRSPASTQCTPRERRKYLPEQAQQPDARTIAHSRRASIRGSWSEALCRLQASEFTSDQHAQRRPHDAAFSAAWAPSPFSRRRGGAFAAQRGDALDAFLKHAPDRGGDPADRHQSVGWLRRGDGAC
jgi:hypothetical protein